MDSVDYITELKIISPVFVFFALISLNYYRFKKLQKEAATWESWLDEKSISKQHVYQSTTDGRGGNICSFCQCSRLHAVNQKFISLDVKYGLFFNKLGPEVKFVSHFCSKCGCELFRSRS
jgi:hypothetical protein